MKPLLCPICSYCMGTVPYTVHTGGVLFLTLYTMQGYYSLRCTHYRGTVSYAVNTAGVLFMQNAFFLIQLLFSYGY